LTGNPRFVSDRLGASPYALKQRLPLTVDFFILLASDLDDLLHVGIGGGHDVRDALIRDRIALESMTDEERS
jgi:hypothetical protein